MRLAWEFVSPVGYCVLLPRSYSSQLSYCQEAPGSSLEPGPQKGYHIYIHLAPEFLHVVFVQLNSPASALALPQGHSVLGRESQDHSAALGRYLACFFLWSCNTLSHLLLPPGCLPHSCSTPWTVSTDMAPTRALDLNFAGSGCEDAMVASEVFEQLPVLGHLGSQHKAIVVFLSSLHRVSPYHNTVYFTSLHIPQHSVVLSYLPVP